MTRISRLTALVVAVVVMAACGTDSTTPTTTTPTSSTIARTRVSGYVHAGPICPVMQNPADPGCEDRPVANALIVVTDARSATVAQARTDSTGRFAILLQEGDYTLVPQAVDGLLGTAAIQEFTVAAGITLELDVAYDTGIR